MIETKIKNLSSNELELAIDNQVESLKGKIITPKPINSSSKASKKTNVAESFDFSFSLPQIKNPVVDVILPHTKAFEIKPHYEIADFDIYNGKEFITNSYIGILERDLTHRD